MILGIDTSNYTTSAAVLDGEALTQQKQLLEVRPGERGLRQSDALFQHTRNLPLLFDKLPDSLTAEQKNTKIRNLLSSLRIHGVIETDSENHQRSNWVLTKNRV